MRTFHVLTADTKDGGLKTVLVDDAGFDGEAEDYFVHGEIVEGSARDEGTVRVESGTARVDLLDTVYDGED